MKSRIEQALAPGNQDIQVRVGQAQLQLSDNRRTVELVGIDVRYLTSDGQPFLIFPEVGVTFSVEAFLKRGVIAASAVETYAPSLILTRTENGAIGLHSTALDDARIADIDFVAFLRHFLIAPSSDERIGYLNKLKIKGGRIAFYDRMNARALNAENADLTLIRRDGLVEGRLSADVMQETGRVTVRLTGRHRNRSERISFDLEASDLTPAYLSPLLASDHPDAARALAGIRLPMRLTTDGDIGFDGTLSPVRFDLEAAAGVVDLPSYLAAPVDVTTVEITGIMAPTFDSVQVERLRAIGHGAELVAAGQASWRSGEIGLALDLAAARVRAEDLRRFWPFGLGDKARNWVLENVETGLLSRFDARIELGPDDVGSTPLPVDSVRGSFAFDDVSVRYVDTMPPLAHASGEATFNADRMDFEVTGGESSGVALDRGTVTITGMGRPGRLATRLKVLAEVGGPIDRALTLLDFPPLEVVDKLQITPQQTSGAVEASLDIRMPLHDDVKEDEVDVLAKARLANVGIKSLPWLGGDVELRGGQFDLVVDAEGTSMEGHAEINGVPLAIEVQEPKIEATAKRRFRIKGALSGALAERIGLAAGAISGQGEFDVTITETASKLWADLDADLTGIGIVFPGFSWSKREGEAGRLRASIAIPDEGTIDARQFELTTTDLRAVGSLQLSRPDYRIVALSLADLAIGDSLATVRLTRNNRFGYDIAIEARQLDLDALIPESDETALDLDRFHLVMQADRLTTKGLSLVDVQADAVRHDGAWRSASFIGALASGGKIAFELTPDGEQQRLDLRSDDAGALITALDLGRRVRGGTFHLTADIASQDPMIVEGRLQIDDFILEDAPLLARLLTVASLTGIGNLLEGEGIQIDQLLLPFSLRDDRLTIKDGLLRGSQIGLTGKGEVDLDSETLDLEGTIIPVYTLNRIIGQLPIIGQILTGSEGRGAFAATYQITGSQSEPTIYVNPLSILAPGLIRELFKGLVDGTLEPPDIRETDD